MPGLNDRVTQVPTSKAPEECELRAKKIHGEKSQIIHPYGSFFLIVKINI